MFDRVCIFTTICASLQDTIEFTTHHVNLGIDLLILFFDNPDDPGIKVVSTWDKVLCIPCSQDHWRTYCNQCNLSIEEKQEINSQVALALSRTKNIDWLIHIDGDEFIVTKIPLNQLLSKVNPGIDLIRFKVLEALPEQLEYSNPCQTIRYFKVHPLHITKAKEFYLVPWGRLQLAIEALTYHLSFTLAGLICPSLKLDFYFRGHAVGKSAVRTKAAITGLRCHYPIPAAGATIRWNIALQARLLHFNCCGFEAWRNKWQRRCDGSGTASRLGPQQLEELQQFTQLIRLQEHQKLPELYQSLYFFSDREKKVLKWLQLLKHLSLNHPKKNVRV